jgi:hypothetical protein
VAEDLEQQEHKDPGRGAVEERLGPQARGPDPAKRQAEVDGEPGDRAEEDRLRGGQRPAPLGTITELGLPKNAREPYWSRLSLARPVGDTVSG